jgi:predicted PurR-regulated permease PerM
VPTRQPVPWRTIFAAVGVVAAALVAYVLIRETARIIAWLVVAGFFALVLAPAVDFVEHRLHLRRGLATAIVFFSGLVLLAAMLWAFITPIVHQVNHFLDALPHSIKEAKHTKGPIGDLIRRYDLDKRYQENHERIQKALSGAGKPALNAARAAAALGADVRVAALLAGKAGVEKGQTVVAVVSGGNIAPEQAAAILAEA